MLKQTQNLKQQQKLAPQQLQAIKLLELTTIELEERIKSEIEENPTLEEGESDEQKELDAEIEKNETNEDEFSIKDYLDDEDDSIPAYKSQTHNYSNNNQRIDYALSSGESFQQYLISQLGFHSLSEHQYGIAVFLIGSIDDDGYLRRDLNFICDDIAFKQNITTNTKELEHVLKIIQTFEPTGVGCRNLQECLLLQLNAKQHTQSVTDAQKIISDCFDEFTKKHYDKIARKIDITEDDLRNAIAEIVKLNPKPGNFFSDDYSEQGKTIIPDFVLDIKDGELVIDLTSYNIPDLRINAGYMQLMREYASKKGKTNIQDKETVQFIGQKITAARYFIDAIQQRQRTLLDVMNIIVDLQRNYFLSGDENQLKPMILKDIAARTILDVSTISRVLNGKYVQTYFGIFPLRYFFSEPVYTKDGEDISNREVKAILQKCIEDEDKSNPLADAELMEILKEKGYDIARRTVTKYREHLNIPVSRLRKEIAIN
ncbi:MAG: RNA polymerase factor sigma-54 [Prevotellaceae bacterium]|jgi:RNA polymerase sigma-54 factor|nr:RNA polymerase factor sigma-54 [Prevotellaceae bacterium]